MRRTPRPARTPLARAAAVALLSVAALPAAPAAAALPATAEEGRTTPTVMVEAGSEQEAARIAARHGLTVARAFPWIGWYELATPAGTGDGAAALHALEADPAVEDADALARGEDLALAYQPKDPAWTFSYQTPGGASQSVAWHLAKTNFPAAWDRTTGQGASIGIVDSEFDTGHPDLQAKVRAPYNTSSGTPDYHTGKTLAADAASLHGTHVAGIAAASTDNGIGVSGGGFDATFVPVKIRTSFTPGGGNPVDAGFVADLTEALGYIANSGVGVVNMSLGTTRHHPPLQDAIAAVRARGITVVASAGNFQQEQPNAPIYPASYPGVIAVANTQSNDAINPSSSNGDWVDVAAPGTDIVSTWDRRDPQSSFSQTDANYHSISGTSMSAPLVTGLVALMKSVRPDLTPDEVEGLLKATARDLGSRGADPQYGAGLIDAFAAVNAAAAYQRPAPPAGPSAPAAPATPAAPAAPPAAPPAGPADTVAPRITVNGILTIRGRTVTTRFRCEEACSGRVRIRTTSRKLLGSASYTGQAGKLVTARVKLKRRVSARSRVIVEVVAKDAAGNVATKGFRRKLRR